MVSNWIDTLFSKTEGNTYAALLHHPFLFKGKPTQAQEVTGWHRSRLGFVTPSIGEVSLGPLGNAHRDKPCKQCD